MYTLSCFADEISPRLDEELDAMERLGIKWMSLRSVDNVNVLSLSDEQVDRIGCALRARGMGVSSIGSPIGKTPIADESDLYLEQTARAIEIAIKLDCPRIRVFSFYMEKDELDARRDEVLRRLRNMSELAARDGITLLHENEAGIYGESSARCRDLLESVGRDNFRAAYDPSNFVAAGEGDAQIRDVLREFTGDDYFLTLEPHLAMAGRNRGFSGVELFGRAHAALTGLLREAGIAYR